MPINQPNCKSSYPHLSLIIKIIIYVCFIIGLSTSIFLITRTVYNYQTKQKITVLLKNSKLITSEKSMHPSSITPEPTSKISPSQTPTTKHEPIFTITPTNIPTIKIEKTITIALLGDSMIDTLGNKFSHLYTQLRSDYPKYEFQLLNYGVGASQLDYAIERLTNNYTYLDKKMPALITTNPDIIVIESFAYNNYGNKKENIDKYHSDLDSLIQSIHTNLPQTKIVLFASIAPNSQIFADGVEGLNFSLQEKKQKTDTIKHYQEIFISYANNNKLLLANAFTPSKDANGEGQIKYINPDDHIHYSASGKQFVSAIIVQSINNMNL